MRLGPAPVRRLYSWGYQLLVRLLFRVSVRDTQVGIKVFTRETLRDAIPYTTERGFAFELELLAVAHRAGHRRIVEAPVRIGHQFTNAVHLRSAARMLWSTISMSGRIRSVVGVEPHYPPGEAEASTLVSSSTDHALGASPERSHSSMRGWASS